jgi:hypothetical protein
VNPYDDGQAIPYPDKAKELVVNYCNQRKHSGSYVYDDTFMTPRDTYVVWFAKTLQNWKALISTVLPDGRYYEVTFNGDKNEYYLDVYEKFDNVKYLENEPSPTVSPTVEEFEASEKVLDDLGPALDASRARREAISREENEAERCR